MLDNSPKGVDLTGLLHGDPGADETGDEAAGEREDRVGGGRGGRRMGGREEEGWVVREGRRGVREGEKGGEGDDSEVSHSSLLARLYLLFIFIIISVH